MSSIRLSAQEAAFVYGEDPRMPLHVGGLSIVEGAPLRDECGAIDLDRIRADIDARLDLAPLFRKRLVEVPFDQGRPVWIDDPRFAIENHVHLIGLPSPGDRAQLMELMGRLQEGMQDRSKPLWEIFFVDGLEEEGRVAMIYRIHHSMIDGATGVALFQVLYDIVPEGRRSAPRSWQPAEPPTSGELLVDAFVDRASWLVQSAKRGIAALSDPRGRARELAGLARVLETVIDDVDALPWNAEVGPLRAFATATFPMERVLALRQGFGVTLNDVVLAAVAGALRRYCGEHGLDPDTLSKVRAIVPVDNRPPGDLSPGSNVSSMIVALAVDESDARRRVIRTHARTTALKDGGVAEGVNVWATVTEQLPATLLRLTSWAQFNGAMGRANVLVSNVRGPRAPLYTMGARILELHPYFGVQHGLGLNITLASYAEDLMLGMTADPELVPDLPALAELLRKSFEELEGCVLFGARGH